MANMSSAAGAEIERNEIKQHWDHHPYYASAEEWVHEFWGADTRFLRLFKELDLSSVLDLACGHGRHSAQILGKVGPITVSDINASNIEACKKRFSGQKNVKYHVGSGSDFKGIGDTSLTAIFCYDAMVHFEIADVWSYVNDCARVLKKGGRALFHYSNYSANPGGHYRDNPHSRTFCSEAAFRHFASRAGLDVVCSETFGWGAPGLYVPGMDALTLLQKP